MNMYDNARLTPKGRGILVERQERGERVQDVAGAMGVSTRTVYKWKRRFLEHGLAGLGDHSSRPVRSTSRTSAKLEAKVVQLRRERRIMDRIVQETGISRATVGRDLEPVDPVVRYERDTPGDLIHIDTKK